MALKGAGTRLPSESESGDVWGLSKCCNATGGGWEGRGEYGNGWEDLGAQDGCEGHRRTPFSSPP